MACSETRGAMTQNFRLVQVGWDAGEQQSNGIVFILLKIFALKVEGRLLGPGWRQTRQMLREDPAVI